MDRDMTHPPVYRKLEEAIRDSGNPPHKPATDMERQVILWSLSPSAL